MKGKRDAGLKKPGVGPGGGLGLGGAVETSSCSSNSGKTGRPRGRPPGPSASRKVKGNKGAKSSASKSTNLTASRVAHIIGQLDNKRGSTMDSIRGKLMRSGQVTKTSLIRTALERAVKAGLLKEVREERFSLPRDHGPSSSNKHSSGSSSSSRTRNTKGSLKQVSSGQSRNPKMPMKMAKRSASRGEAKLRQRRPPQGRRPAVTSASGESPVANEDDIREEEDTGVGDGDIDDGHSCNNGHSYNNGYNNAHSYNNGHSNNGTVEKGSSRVSVSEPVAGCDAVMVFGTH